MGHKQDIHHKCYLHRIHHHLNLHSFLPIHLQLNYYKIDSQFQDLPIHHHLHPDSKLVFLQGHHIHLHNHKGYWHHHQNNQDTHHYNLKPKDSHQQFHYKDRKLYEDLLVHLNLHLYNTQVKLPLQNMHLLDFLI